MNSGRGTVTCVALAEVDDNKRREEEKIARLFLPEVSHPCYIETQEEKEKETQLLSQHAYHH